MPRVLFVDQFARMGGGQRILLDVVEHFAGEGFACAVALPEEGPLEGLLCERGIPTKRFSFPVLRAGNKAWRDQLAYVPAVAAASRQISAISEEFRADVVFCNGPRLIPSVVAASGKLGLPAICAVHLIFGGKERALLSWCFRKPSVRAVTFCSSAAAAAFPNLPAEKRVLTGNWVSPHFVSCPHYEKAKTLFGMRDDAVAVGVVGRLSPKKGQAKLLEAMSPILKGSADVVLVVAGSSDFEDPAEEDRLRTLAKDFGISDRVLFLGNVANTVALMDALDILVVPSMWEEPFGLVAVEGMARGLPIVATHSGGLVDIVEDGVTGCLVDKTAEALQDSISRLLNDGLERREMGAKGRIRALGAFGAAERLRQLADLARRLAGEGAK